MTALDALRRDVRAAWRRECLSAVAHARAFAAREADAAAPRMRLGALGDDWSVDPDPDPDDPEQDHLDCDCDCDADPDPDPHLHLHLEHDCEREREHKHEHVNLLRESPAACLDVADAAHAGAALFRAATDTNQLSRLKKLPSLSPPRRAVSTVSTSNPATPATPASKTITNSSTTVGPNSKSANRPVLLNSKIPPPQTSEIANLRSANAALAAENNSLKDALHNHSATIEALNATVKALRRDKNVLEKSLRANEHIPSKGDRQQIDLLKQKLSAQQSAAADSAHRAALANDRLRSRVADLTRRLEDSTDEVKLLETQRATLREKVRDLEAALAHATTSASVSAAAATLPPAAAPAREHTHATAHGDYSTQAPPSATAHTASRARRAEKRLSQDGSHAQTNHFAVEQAQNELNKVQETIGYAKEPYTEINHPAGKITRTFTTLSADEAAPVTLSRYKNGTIKLKHPSHTMVFFANGDTKKTTADESVYFYASRDILHTTDLRTQTQTIEFRACGQIERRFRDGRQEVWFADGTVKYVHADGREEFVFGNLK
ncbi:hypothetical protein HDU84_004779 [Entophlyctis sp. JEL0112]|nr:hypothetical protein HDU84_004779 [Entophlyctis sp. JEL0112]